MVVQGYVMKRKVMTWVDALRFYQLILRGE